MWILGLSCFRDDATAALLEDGAVVGISEEERFLRVKHAVARPPGLFVSSLGESEAPDGFELRYFPEQSINYLLFEAGIELTDIDIVAYDFDFDRRIRHWDRFVPVSELASARQNEQSVAMLRYWQRMLADFAERCGARLEYVPHHLAHASGTVFGSGYREAAFLVMDALGELESSTLGYFDGVFHITRQAALPHSLGIVYAAVTSFLGFRPFSDEQKTMGLAAYSEPAVFAADFGQILHPAAEVCRPPYTHIAAALQQALERVVNHLADQALAITGSRRLCLAGGVALNCAANGTLLTRGDVDELCIQPQAGDSGTALGAAYYAHFRTSGSRPEPLPHAYWGPGYAGSEVRALLDRLKLPYRRTGEPWEALFIKGAEFAGERRKTGSYRSRSCVFRIRMHSPIFVRHPGQSVARSVLAINKLPRAAPLHRSGRAIDGSQPGLRRSLGPFPAADSRAPDTEQLGHLLLGVTHSPEVARSSCADIRADAGRRIHLPEITDDRGEYAHGTILGVTALGDLDRDRIRALHARELAQFREERPRSVAMIDRAREHMPGGVPMVWMDFDNDLPIYIDHGQGASITDVDGFTYVDFNASGMAMFCGHANPQIVAAVQAQAARSTQFLLPTQASVEVAEELARRYPVPLWQFTLSATQANTEAIRLARAATGRDVIVLFQGHYHGTFDEGRVDLEDGRVTAVQRGLAKGVTGRVRIAQFNDAATLRQALEPGDVALVLTEPAMTNAPLLLPEPGWHEELRSLTRQYGTLLVIDETHSNVVGPGGATALWGLQPDVVTIGKAVAGGLPMGAYGVTAELGEQLDAARNVATGGTLFGNPLSAAAAKAALTQVLTPDAYAHTAALGGELADGIEQAIGSAGLPWTVIRFGPRSGQWFGPMPHTGAEAHALTDGELTRLIRIWLANRGVWEALPDAGPAVSVPSTSADVARYLEAYNDLLAQLK